MGRHTDSGRADGGDVVGAVAAFIDARGLLRAGDGVVVAVSGGPDSVALLAVLRDLAARPDRAYRLTVAHLNHRLRDEADRDAAFVADLARRWRLPCISDSRDVRALAVAGALSIETAARQARYEFLAAAAESCTAAAVAVGHHADDNVETVLDRIIRGTHLRGLAGIPACRTLTAGVRLVRPLLELTRRQIEGFCHARGLAWRTDATNAQTAFRRNFIRHELLPLLAGKLNQRAAEAILRLAAAAEQVEDYMSARGDEAFAAACRRDDGETIVLGAAALAGRHPALRAYALRAAMEKLGCPLRKLTAGHLAPLSGAAPAAVRELPGGIAARVSGDEIILVRRAGPPPADDGWQVELACPGRTVLPDGRAVLCQVGPLDRAAFEAHRAAAPGGVEMLDADAVRPPLLCRPRRQGDAFVPLGCPGRQTVSDFLTNARLPPRERRGVLCVLDAAGVVYLAPLRIAERAKVTPATSRVLRVELSPPPAAAIPTAGRRPQ